MQTTRRVAVPHYHELPPCLFVPVVHTKVQDRRRNSERVEIDDRKSLIKCPGTGENRAGEHEDIEEGRSPKPQNNKTPKPQLDVDGL